jgi:hypothetical protein
MGLHSISPTVEKKCKDFVDKFQQPKIDVSKSNIAIFQTPILSDMWLGVQLRVE